MYVRLTILHLHLKQQSLIKKHSKLEFNIWDGMTFSKWKKFICSKTAFI